MSPTQAVIEGIIPFLTGLRSDGYRLPLDQVLAARRLLEEMDRHGALPTDLRELSGWIGPIVCASEREQLEFPSKFKNWLISVGAIEPDAKIGPSTGVVTSVDGVQELWAGLRRYWKLGIALIGLVIVTVTALAIYYYPQSNTNIIVNLDVTPQASEVEREVRHFSPLAVVVVGEIAFLVSAGTWVLLRVLRSSRDRTVRRLIARSGAGGNAEGEGGDVFDFKIDVRDRFAPASRRALSRAASGLLLREEAASPSEVLDVDPTLRRMFHQPGPIVPIYKARKITPEYLILIDRASAHDLQAEMAESIVESLRKAQVPLLRFEFRKDPRACWPLAGTHRERSVKLADLLERLSNHRVLIFTDASGFIDPRNGRPAAWLRFFSKMPLRAILTPNPRATWSRLEQDLGELGFQVVSASPAGLMEIARGCSGPHGVSVPETAVSELPVAPLPRLIRDDPDVWLDASPPEAIRIQRLLSDLRWYLKEDFEWFAACAVYPEVRADLTWELGRLVRGDERTEVIEEGLARLARLPWFREGVMPDWLRLILLKELSEERKLEIKEAINQLILEAPRIDLKRISTRVGHPSLRTGLNELQSSDRREILRATDPAGPWSDPLLTSLMDGNKVDPLAFELPRNVQELVQQWESSVAVAPTVPDAAVKARPANWLFKAIVLLFNAVVRVALFIGLISSALALALSLQSGNMTVVGWVLVIGLILLSTGSRLALPARAERNDDITLAYLIPALIWEFLNAGISIFLAVFVCSATVGRLIGASSLPSTLFLGIASSLLGGGFVVWSIAWVVRDRREYARRSHGMWGIASVVLILLGLGAGAVSNAHPARQNDFLYELGLAAIGIAIWGVATLILYLAAVFAVKAEQIWPTAKRGSVRAVVLASPRLMELLSRRILPWAAAVSLLVCSGGGVWWYVQNHMGVNANVQIGPPAPPKQDNPFDPKAPTPSNRAAEPAPLNTKQAPIDPKTDYNKNPSGKSPAKGG